MICCGYCWITDYKQKQLEREKKALLRKAFK